MLDKKIQFYKQVNSQDQDTGKMIGTPIMVLETWAEKSQQTSHFGSSRDTEAGETVMNDQVKWKIRKRASFTPDKSMYILYNGQKHIIHRIMDKDDRNELFLHITTTVQDIGQTGDNIENDLLNYDDSILAMDGQNITLD